jgi:hypothetical protein
MATKLFLLLVMATRGLLWIFWSTPGLLLFILVSIIATVVYAEFGFLIYVAFTLLAARAAVSMPLWAVTSILLAAFLTALSQPLLEPLLLLPNVIVSVIFLVRVIKPSVVQAVSKVQTVAEEHRRTFNSIIRAYLTVALVALRTRRITRVTVTLMISLFAYPFLALIILWISLVGPLKLGDIILRLVGLDYMTELLLMPSLSALADWLLEAGQVVLTFVIPALSGIILAFTLWISTALHKSRTRSELSISLMFLELLIAGAVLIHYMNIVSPDSYHYGKMAWPGQTIDAWVYNWDLYLKSVADSLFISFLSITLIGLTALELNSYPAKAMYAIQGFVGVYFFVLAIRRLRD